MDLLGSIILYIFDIFIGHTWKCVCKAGKTYSFNQMRRIIYDLHIRYQLLRVSIHSVNIGLRELNSQIQSINFRNLKKKCTKTSNSLTK